MPLLMFIAWIVAIMYGLLVIGLLAIALLLIPLALAQFAVETMREVMDNRPREEGADVYGPEWIERKREERRRKLEEGGPAGP